MLIGWKRNGLRLTSTIVLGAYFLLILICSFHVEEFPVLDGSSNQESRELKVHSLRRLALESIDAQSQSIQAPPQLTSPVVHAPPSVTSPLGHSPLPVTSQPTLVVLLSYERCGTTFVGKLFSENPDVYSWFEPLDALYSSLYGTMAGWNVPTDINYYNDGTPRTIPQWELDAVSQFLKHLLTCDVTSLPTESLLHRYNNHYTIKNQSKDYAECLQANNISLGYLNVQSLENYCGRRFNQMTEKRISKCRLLLKDPSDSSVNTTSFNRRKFQQRRNSLNEQRNILFNACISICLNTCAAKRIRAAKVVRASMRSLVPILRDLPNVRVIHLVRDPRGVALSRVKTHQSVYGIWARNSPNNDSSEMIVREASTYCRSVVEDIWIRHELDVRHPGQLLEVVYDELVKDVKLGMKTIGEFIGMTSPRDVILRNRLNTKIGKIYQKEVVRYIVRPGGWPPERILSSRVAYRIIDGVHIARQWEEELTDEDVERIGSVCEEFFKIVKHNWTGR